MNAPPPLAADDAPPRRAWALALVIAAVFFAAVAPTLRWLEYSSGNENIVVQTALEMRHGGPILLPQMLGVPRVKKPPLVAWVTAAAMRPATVEKLDDPKRRDAAYADLSFQTRWPALLAACVTILATFEIGRLWAGASVGLTAAMAVCTNYLFLKYMRQSTTDAHLTAWVAVANACFVHGLLRGRWWAAAVGGGLATGLAFLCKGPVALAETVLPAAALFGVLHAGRTAGERRSVRPTAWVAAAVGVLLFLGVATPWFAYAWRHVPGVAATWRTEVGREGATDLETGNPAVYLLLGAWVAPWVVFGLVGLLTLGQRRRERAAWLPVIFAVVPLLVMVWFRDRKERYALPMIVPAAIVCGYGAVAWVRNGRTQRTWADIAVGVAHGVTVLGAGALLLVAGATSQTRLDGRPWYSPALAAWAGVALVCVAGLTVVLQRRRAWAMPVATFVVMIALLVTYLYGYREGEHGRSPLKPLADAIRTRVPGAAVYDWLPRGRVDEQIAVYLNRTILRADPATLTPFDRPIVVITRQGKRDGPPVLPAGWELLAKANEGPAVVWFAYVRRVASH